MHPDGSGERSISPVADDAPSYLSIDWSPDSRLVTYARHADDESGYRVYAVDIGTATETLLTPETPSGTDHWWPTYSPDGAGLASGGGDQSGAAVFVGGADGSGWRQLELAQGVSTEDVTWSPDGRSILVFEHSFDSLLVVPVDDPGAAVAIPTGGSAGSPSWQRRPA
jgi:Tol biopolymer transport system component